MTTRFHQRKGSLGLGTEGPVFSRREWNKAMRASRPVSSTIRRGKKPAPGSLISPMGRRKASRHITTEKRSQKRLQQIFIDLTTHYPPPDDQPIRFEAISFPHSMDGDEHW